MTARVTCDLRTVFDGLVRPGDRIVWGQCAGEPLSLTEALVAQRAQIGQLSAFVGATFSDTLRPEHADHLAIASFGAVGTLRRLAAAGALEIIPCHSGQIYRYILDGLIGCDVALVQVSPPGPEGQFSFGVTHDYMGAALHRARRVIAEVNDQVPWTGGGEVFPSERVDLFLETSRPLVQVPSMAPGWTDEAIARQVAHFVGDGATLQLGIGAVPSAVLRALTDRRDLGLHLPMLTDTAVELIEEGVVTNARKPVDAGVTVTGLLLGTDRLYRFAHRNTEVAVRGSYQISDERVLAAIPDLVTINSAIEVDLTGQVNAEEIGGRFVGAVGGQADFVRAGHRSVGGRSIVALPSTAGAASRIVTRLGGPVTTARSDVDVIVTEFGAAELRAQPLAERARRLIRIAHPDHREVLERAARAV